MRTLFNADAAERAQMVQNLERFAAEQRSEPVEIAPKRHSKAEKRRLREKHRAQPQALAGVARILGAAP